MSYAHNKRKKNRAKFEELMCNTFDEFCTKRNRPAPMLLTKEQYDQEMYLWLNYKKYYKMEMTMQERAWASNHAKEAYSALE